MTTPVAEKGAEFTPAELTIFVQEITDMITAGETVDIARAVHNAKYLAEIDRRLANVGAVKFGDDSSI